MKREIEQLEEQVANASASASSTSTDPKASEQALEQAYKRPKLNQGDREIHLLIDHGPRVRFDTDITKHQFMTMCNELRDELGYKHVLPEPIMEGGLLFIADNEKEYKSIRFDGRMVFQWPFIKDDTDKTWLNNQEKVVTLIDSIPITYNGEAKPPAINTFLKHFIYGKNVPYNICRSVFSKMELEAIFQITEKYGIVLKTKVKQVKYNSYF